MKQLGFFGKIRNRFILSFSVIVAVLTAAIIGLLWYDYKDMTNQAARESMTRLSESIFQTLFFAMNNGGSEQVHAALDDAKRRKIVERLDLHVSKEIIESFRLGIEVYNPPQDIRDVFENREQLARDEFEKGKLIPVANVEPIGRDDRLIKRGARFIKPFIAEEQCVVCHFNVTNGTVLGVMDLTISQDRYDEISTESIKKVVLVMLGLIVVGGVIMNFASSSLIFNPLYELREAVKRLAGTAGDPDVRLQERGYNEFGEVAHHFNRFIDKVYVINRRLTTEQKKTQKLLEEREIEFQRRVDEVRKSDREQRRYVEIVDSNVIISRTDPSGVITTVSEAFSRASGYSKEELINMPHNIVRHPTTPASVFVEMWHTIKAGAIWQGELKNRKKDGSPYWVRMVISPLFNDQNEIKGFVAVCLDITEQKELEALMIKPTDQDAEAQTSATQKKTLRFE
ncbi:MAG: PAS domain S-box protein [Helicobacteraceae bacterium]|jgi:PAS domain S-box-containing protein|nr:PAS domain S-box protein [Helicobacteraceae bacterium]